MRGRFFQACKFDGEKYLPHAESKLSNLVILYTRWTKVLQHPNHNGVQIFWNFTTSKISIPLLGMLNDKNVLNLESNARKFMKDFNNDRTVMIS